MVALDAFLIAREGGEIKNHSLSPQPSHTASELVCICLDEMDVYKWGRKKERDRQKDTEGGVLLLVHERVCTFSFEKPGFHSRILIQMMKITELEKLNRDSKL